MISDFIANEITKIRNAVTAGHSTVTLFTNKVILCILKILLDNGFISGYKINTNDKNISTADVELKYNPTSAIVEIKRVSTPGHRIYVSSDNLPRIYNGLGIAIISTSKGIMTNKEAKRNNIGGEVICTVF